MHRGGEINKGRGNMKYHQITKMYLQQLFCPNGCNSNGPIRRKVRKVMFHLAASTQCPLCPDLSFFWECLSDWVTSVFRPRYFSVDFLLVVVGIIVVDLWTSLLCDFWAACTILATFVVSSATSTLIDALVTVDVCNHFVLSWKNKWFSTPDRLICGESAGQ